MKKWKLTWFVILVGLSLWVVTLALGGAIAVAAALIPTGTGIWAGNCLVWLNGTVIKLETRCGIAWSCVADTLNDAGTMFLPCCCIKI